MLLGALKKMSTANHAGERNGGGGADEEEADKTVLPGSIAIQVGKTERFLKIKRRENTEMDALFLFESRGPRNSLLMRITWPESM